MGETFCEVVVHDLTDPKNAILAIHNNLSGRRVGQPPTELEPVPPRSGLPDLSLEALLGGLEEKCEDRRHFAGWLRRKLV